MEELDFVLHDSERTGKKNYGLYNKVMSKMPGI